MNATTPQTISETLKSINILASDPSQDLGTMYRGVHRLAYTLKVLNRMRAKHYHDPIDPIEVDPLCLGSDHAIAYDLIRRHCYMISIFSEVLDDEDQDELLHLLTGVRYTLVNG